MPNPPCILIVDDDPGVVRLLERVLGREGFTTLAAGSGREVLALPEASRPDLMLLDLKLSDMAGAGLVERMGGLGTRLPFVVITGQGDERVAVEVMKLGALDYLVKDERFLEFVPAVVRRCLVQLERDRKLAQAEEALRRSESNLARAQRLARLGSYEVCLEPGGVDYWSEETWRILGLEVRDAPPPLAELLSGRVHPGDQDRVRQGLQRSLETGRPYELEFRMVRPDGAVRTVLCAGEVAWSEERGRRVGRVVGTILDLTERRELEREVLEISEREQRRIGHDLHDGLCQELAGIELRSRVLEQRLAVRGLREDSDQAGKLSRLVRETIAHTRSLARGLSPVMKNSEGLAAALQELATNTADLFHIGCELEGGEDRWSALADPVAAGHLYRIAQEAVSNAIKHGRARRVTIRLAGNPDVLTLSVRDDGVGFPEVMPAGVGMGMRVMRYRAGMISGELSVGRGQSGGTVVSCTVVRTRGRDETKIKKGVAGRRSRRANPHPAR